MTVLDGRLAEISQQARPYPADLLPEGGTALALFAAAYMGHNDSIHFARKNMRATCVDRDYVTVCEMAVLYPSDWRFVTSDAWTFAEDAAAAGETWDAVSVDTFTGKATERSLQSLELWCELANVIVTATMVDGQKWVAPTGWHGSLYLRSTIPNRPNTYWLVLGRG